MESYEFLIKILEESVKRNGADKPVTIGHLLNIIKLAKKARIKFENSIDSRCDASEVDIW